MAKLEDTLTYTYGRLAWLILVIVWLAIVISGDSSTRRWFAPSIAMIFAVGTIAYAILVYRSGDLGKDTDVARAYWKMHMLAAILHLASANGIAFATGAKDIGWYSRLTRSTSQWVPYAWNASAWVPVTKESGVSSENRTCSNFPCVIDTGTTTVTDSWPLVDLSVMFALVSGVYHVACAFYRNFDTQVDITGKTQPLAEAGLRSRVNPFRWLDYSISASIMLAVVAGLNGQSDVGNTLVPSALLFILLDSTIRLEQRFNGTVQPTTSPINGPQSAFLILFLAYIITWYPSVSSFLSAWEGSSQDPPDVIYTILVAILVLYTVFAGLFFFCTVLRWGPATASEEGFLILSLLSKTCLHWLLYTGTVGRHDRIYTDAGQLQDLPHAGTTYSGGSTTYQSPFTRGDGGMNTDDTGGILASTLGTFSISIIFAIYVHYVILKGVSVQTKDNMSEKLLSETAM